MSQPYIGEIRMFAGNFAPSGWALCQGQLIPISENDVLFQLIGRHLWRRRRRKPSPCPATGKPRAASHGHKWQGTTFQIGQAAGAETVTLITQQIPQSIAMVESTVAAATAAEPRPRQRATR